VNQGGTRGVIQAPLKKSRSENAKKNKRRPCSLFSPSKEGAIHSEPVQSRKRSPGEGKNLWEGTPVAVLGVVFYSNTGNRELSVLGVISSGGGALSGGEIRSGACTLEAGA